MKRRREEEGRGRGKRRRRRKRTRREEKQGKKAGKEDVRMFYTFSHRKKTRESIHCSILFLKNNSNTTTVS